MLSARQQGEFFERGYTRISGVIDEAELRAVSAEIWKQLERHGIRQAEPQSWRRPRPKGLQSTAKQAQYDRIFGAAVRGCIDDLLGAGCWQEPNHWGQLLVSLPADETWVVPSKAWHLDLPEGALSLERPGVQLFVCIEDVRSQCGATVVATGLHHQMKAQVAGGGLPGTGASATLRTRLARESEWLARLLKEDGSVDRNQAFFEQTHLEQGRPLRVEELVGRRGDLILVHPFLLHAPAPNVGPQLRLALTQRVYANA